MKMLVIGLDGAAPEILFSDESLINFHRVMEFGCYGRLESNRPLIAEQAWLSLAVGQNPGAIPGITVWDQVIRQGNQAVIVGWLPFEVAEREGLIVRGFEDEVLDAEDLVIGDQAELKGRIYSTSRGQFETAGQLLQGETWNYFQFIETGLGHVQRALRQSGNLEPVIVHDYYRHLDTQLGNILEALSEDTVVVVSFIQSARAGEQTSEVPSPNSVPLGFFILAAPNNPLSGEIEGAQLIDIAPTLLELGGYDIPDSMQGQPLVSGASLDASNGLTTDEEEILRERLSGLGYI
jgi:hypothetical protein